MCKTLKLLLIMTIQPPSLTSPSLGYSPPVLSLQRGQSDGSSKRSPLTTLPTATVILRSTPPNSPSAKGSAAAARTTPTSSPKTFSLPENTSPSGSHSGVVKSLTQKFEKAVESTSSKSLKIISLPPKGTTASVKKPLEEDNKKEESDKKEALDKAKHVIVNSGPNKPVVVTPLKKAVTILPTKPLANNSTAAAGSTPPSATTSTASSVGTTPKVQPSVPWTPPRQAQINARNAAQKPQVSGWTAASKASEMERLNFKIIELANKKKYPIFCKRGEAGGDATVSTSDYHWCWAVSDKRREGRFSLESLNHAPRFNEFLAAHPKLWLSHSALSQEIEKTISDNLLPMLKVKWRNEFFTENPHEFIGIADMYSLEQEDSSWSMSEFWRYAIEQEVEKKEFSDLQTRWNAHRDSLLKELSAKFPQLEALIKNDPQADFIQSQMEKEKNEKTGDDKTKSLFNNRRTSVPKKLQKDYEHFVAGHNKDISSFKAYVNKSHAEFWKDLPNKPFAERMQNHERNFLINCSKEIYSEIKSLLDEYQQHSFERFHRLFKIHASYINNILIAGTSAEVAAKEKPSGEESVQAYVLKRMLNITEHNTVARNESYRSTQGAETYRESAACFHERSRFNKTISMIFTKSLTEKSLIMKWEDAHTVPAPGLFSWQVVLPKKNSGSNAAANNEADKKENNLVHKIDSVILQNPFLNAFTDEEDIKAAFQCHIYETFKEVNTLDRAINNIMFEISLWSLLQTSETEHLPHICNMIDQYSEYQISQFIECDQKQKSEKNLSTAKDYKSVLREGLLNLLKQSISSKTGEVTFANVVNSQRIYCEATKKSLRKKLDDLKRDYSETTDPSERVYILMQRQMLGSHYAALRYAEFIAGISSNKDDDLELTNFSPAAAGKPTTLTVNANSAAVSSMTVKTVPPATTSTSVKSTSSAAASSMTVKTDPPSADAKSVKLTNSAATTSTSVKPVKPLSNERKAPCTNKNPTLQVVLKGNLANSATASTTSTAAALPTAAATVQPSATNSAASATPSVVNDKK